VLDFVEPNSGILLREDELERRHNGPASHRCHSESNEVGKEDNSAESGYRSGKGRVLKVVLKGKDLGSMIFLFFLVDTSGCQ